jgi:hypothetical protein
MLDAPAIDAPERQPIAHPLYQRANAVARNYLYARSADAVVIAPPELTFSIAIA